MKKKKKTKVKSRPKIKAKKVRKKVKPKVKKRAKAKKLSKKAQAEKRKMTVIPPANSVLLGRVEDYFAKIGVIAFTLQHVLRVGDHIHILGHTTNLEQAVDSLQIDHQPVSEAASNAAVGIKVTARARRGDYVFLIP